MTRDTASVGNIGVQNVTAPLFVVIRSNCLAVESVESDHKLKLAEARANRASKVDGVTDSGRVDSLEYQLMLATWTHAFPPLPSLQLLLTMPDAEATDRQFPCVSPPDVPADVQRRRSPAIID